MFPVISRIKSKTNQKELNILLIQNGYERYCKHLSSLENVNIYLYNSWGIPQTETPGNVITISDKQTPIVGSFDKIICMGKADSLKIAEEIRNKFSIELIVVNDSSEETYCPRPFTFSINQKMEYRASKEVSLSPCLNLPDIDVIPYVEEENLTGLAKKEDTVCVFDKVHPSIFNGVTLAAQNQKIIGFNEQNISSSKVFLDTIIGYTSHLLEALSYGCVPVVPHCDEVERLLGGVGYMYKNYSEISGYIESARKDQTDRNRFREIHQGCITSKQNFINKWNYILGRGQF